MYSLCLEYSVPMPPSAWCYAIGRVYEGRLQQHEANSDTVSKLCECLLSLTHITAHLMHILYHVGLKLSESFKAQRYRIHVYCTVMSWC